MIGRAYLWGLAANGQAGRRERARHPARRHRLGAARPRPRLGRTSWCPATCWCRRASPGRSVSRDAGSPSCGLAAARARRGRRPARWSRSARPSSTARTCRSAPTPTSPSRSPTALAAARPDVVVAPAAGLRLQRRARRLRRHALDRQRRRPSWSLVELCRSATATFARVLLVSPTAATPSRCARAVAQLRAEGRDVRAWAPALGRRRPRRPGRDLADAGARAGAGAAASAPSPATPTPLAELMPALRERRGPRGRRERRPRRPRAAPAPREGERAARGASPSSRTLVARWPAAGAARERGR